MQRSSVGKFVKVAGFVSETGEVDTLKQLLLEVARGCIRCWNVSPRCNKIAFLSRLTTLLVHLRVRAVG